MWKAAAFATSLALVSTSPVFGHEFWISPQDYTVPVNKEIVAHLRVGQNFAGASFAYIPNNFVRFEIVSGNEVVPVEGRIGDRPALRVAPPHDGLWTIVHETTDSRLTWTEWDKFVAFVEHKDLKGTLENHAARGLPQTGFSESYRRFAKSLVAVGNGAGQDQRVGLRTEIVALANPYTDDVIGGLPVQVLFEDAPRADAQVEVFAKDYGGDVEVTTLRTNTDGIAMIPVKPGFIYLVDAVVMLPLDAADPEIDPAWQSLWAGLTFEMPN